MKKKKIDGARVKIKIIKSKPEKSVKSEKPAKQIKQKTSTPIRVGGMALSGGVMMRSAHFLAVAFDDGNKIDVRGRRLKSVRLRHTIFTWPFVRGVVMMVEAFVAAIASYSFASRNIKPKPVSHKVKRSYDCFSFVFYLVVVVMFFDYALTELGQIQILQSHNILYNILSGVIFVLFFVAALTLVYQGGEHSIFSYHGAEHKTINAYEHGAKLEPSEIKKYSRLHPRCGSIVGGYTIIIGSILTSLISLRMNPLLYSLLSFLLFVVSFSLAYELTLILISNTKYRLARVILWPALGFQAILTREPTVRQIEVATAALEEVIKREKESDKLNTKDKK